MAAGAGAEETLEQWTARVCAAMGLPADLADEDVRTLVLDLARDVAHGVARPAAPLTTFLAGVAVGRAGADAASVREVADQVQGLLPPS